MFEKGDIVECIDDSGLQFMPKIKKGTRYIVSDVGMCCIPYVDIGLFNSKKARCAYCHGNITDKALYRASRFRKIEPLYRAVEVSEQVMKELKLITEGIEQTERIDK